MSAIFELEDITFAHHQNLKPVMDGFSLKIEEGSHTAILGANGAGKTTLFYTLTGVYKPQKGQVLYKGEPLEYTQKGLQRIRSEAAVVLQNPDEQIFCSLVEEDIAFGPLNLDLPRDVVEERVDAALKAVRMTPFRKRPLQQLSGGQRKRVAIAGALAMQPKVMIMDEPTAGLDPQASMEVIELAEKLSLSGVTVLISTHDIDIAYRWADVSSVLNHGKIEFSGDSNVFYSNTEMVYRCGLLVPSMFAMNNDVSTIRGQEPSPYPKNVCEFSAKFCDNVKSGRVLLTPCDQECAAEKYEAATSDMKDAYTAVYGSDVRYALTDRNIDIMFDALDSCMTEAIRGNDSILFYDRIYKPIVEAQIERLKGFGFDVDTEVFE